MSHKCLLVKTKDLALNDLIWGITEAGHECECVALDCKLLDFDEKEYACDISFVGMQYVDGRYAYFRNHLIEQFQDELNNIAYEMMARWDNTDHIHGTMSEQLIKAMMALLDNTPENAINMPERTYFEEVVIARAVAYTERRLMMEAVADLNPRWYGADAEGKDQISGVDYRPRLYYEDTLPKAYNLSRINLSTGLHSISSGVPLRVFDIMGAGGFIITNYQPEIPELFDV
jgi:spore maturation protein CgeB